MKRKEVAAIRKTVLCVVAGLAALQLAREVPSMIRYFKMKRL